MYLLSNLEKRTFIRQMNQGCLNEVKWKDTGVQRTLMHRNILRFGSSSPQANLYCSFLHWLFSGRIWISEVLCPVKSREKTFQDSVEGGLCLTPSFFSNSLPFTLASHFNPWEHQATGGSVYRETSPFCYTTTFILNQLAIIFPFLGNAYSCIMTQPALFSSGHLLWGL